MSEIQFSGPKKYVEKTLQEEKGEIWQVDLLLVLILPLFVVLCEVAMITDRAIHDSRM